ncbi:hypothetical protein [Streptomyces sp. NPDC058620]|uniref:hypothetical protein n=1 Tax=Streptomyces sp. NPDC058620 TaxID=3346560 RepID=UPI003669EC68
MSADTTAYAPLHDPADDSDAWASPLDMALDLARASLAEQAIANIHDDKAMLRAAVQLETRLRELVAALDKEAGR